MAPKLIGSSLFWQDPKPIPAKISTSTLSGILSIASALSYPLRSRLAIRRRNERFYGTAIQLTCPKDSIVFIVEK
jgi:hypothetical protein